MKDEMHFLAAFYGLICLVVATFLSVMLILGGLPSLFLIVIPLFASMAALLGAVREGRSAE